MLEAEEKGYRRDACNAGSYMFQCGELRQP